MRDQLEYLDYLKELNYKTKKIDGKDAKFVKNFINAAEERLMYKV